MEEGSKKNKVKQARKQCLEVGGRKCNDEELENEFVHWIYKKRKKMWHVSRKMIAWKAKSIFDKESNDIATQNSFAASRGWCEKFMGGTGSISEEKQQLLKKTHPT